MITRLMLTGKTTRLIRSVTKAFEAGKLLRVFKWAFLRLCEANISRAAATTPKCGALLLAAIVAGVGASACQPARGEPSAAFEFVELLGRTWINERVRFPLGAGQRRAAKGTAMVASDGSVVPFEIVEMPGGPAVEFIADLPARGRTAYRLKPGVAVSSDLVVAERADDIRITNGHGGIAMRTRLAGEEGPILAFRNSGGNWSGGSRLLPHAVAGRIVSYEAKVERRGPVAAVVSCRTVFASGLVWELRLTMQAGDPSILVDELWSAWDHPAVEIEPAAATHLDQLYFRSGAGKRLGQVVAAPMTPEKTEVEFELEPWLRWWVRERRGTSVTLHGAQASDAVIFAALRGDLWIEPADIAAGRKLELLRVINRDGRPVLFLPGAGHRRQALIAAMPREVAVDRTVIGQRLATPAQRLVIKHGNLPLDRVKKMLVEWPLAPVEARPRLLLTNEDVKRLQSGPPLAADRLARLRAGPLNEFLLGEHIDAALRSNDPRLRAKLSAAAVPAMQAAVNAFVKQGEYFSFGAAPHHQRYIMYAAHLADFALSDPATDDATRRRLLAQAVFLSHLVHRPDYWSPARGLAANPNMTSIVAGYQGLLACLVHDHPKGREWLDAALAELSGKQLLQWSDENGGWLEAPHYAMLSYDHMLGVFVCARNQGRDDYLYHPRMRKVIEWLAKITTPPDSRIGGRRHLPPIGNTYMLEPTGQFGTVANLWRTFDLNFAKEMQWMHLQSGSPVHSGVGGYSPAMGAVPNCAQRPNAAAPSARLRLRAIPENRGDSAQPLRLRPRDAAAHHRR